MSAPTSEVETEIRSVLESNTNKMGVAYRLLQEGKVTNAEIVAGGAAANSGAASNVKTIVNTILSGECPTSPSIAAQVGRAIGGLLKTHPDLTAATYDYLTALRSELDAFSQDTEAVEREDRQIEAASEDLERSIEDLDGVYVYTFPTYFRTVQKIDPERILLKVGKTDRFNSIRIREQQRATNMPEDPWMLRVYRSPTISPEDLERKFHKMLDAAGHGRSNGRRAGKEWFYTNLEFLDAIAEVLSLDVHKPRGLE